MTQVDKKQIQGLVKERNEYKQLLDECLYAFNCLPNKRINDGDGGSTYKIAAKIEQAFTEENIEELKTHLKRMQQDNPDLEYSFFKQSETTKLNTPDIVTIVKEIKEKIDLLERKLDLIFDGHVLIDGAFRKIPG